MKLLNSLLRLGTRRSLKEALAQEGKSRDANLSHVRIALLTKPNGGYELLYLCRASPSRTGIGTDEAVIFKRHDLLTEDGARGAAADDVAQVVDAYPDTVFSFFGRVTSKPLVFDPETKTWKPVPDVTWSCGQCGQSAINTGARALEDLCSPFLRVCMKCGIAMARA